MQVHKTNKHIWYIEKKQKQYHVKPTNLNKFKSNLILMMIAVSPQVVGHLQMDIYSNTISRIRNNRTTAIKLFNALRIILHNNPGKIATL